MQYSKQTTISEQYAMELLKEKMMLAFIEQHDSVVKEYGGISK